MLTVKKREMLTIEELKALEIGDWIWVIDEEFKNARYREITIQDNTAPTLLYLSSSYSDSRKVYSYNDYGTKWVAYRNKEEAEGLSTSLPCKIGDTVYGVYPEHNCDYKILETECISFEVTDDEIKIITSPCDYVPYPVEYFLDKKQAKSKLKRLQKYYGKRVL